MKLFLSVLSLFYMGSTPGRGAVISPSGVIWYVRPSQAAACDRKYSNKNTKRNRQMSSNLNQNVKKQKRRPKLKGRYFGMLLEFGTTFGIQRKMVTSSGFKKNLTKINRRLKIVFLNSSTALICLSKVQQPMEEKFPECM